MPESSARMNESVQTSAKSASDEVPIYKPRGSSMPSQVLPNPEYIAVLDQGQEGAAVGHGMATMIDYLLRERGIYERVSVRMLQQLSKQYGNSPLDQDQGSFLRDGMRGWFENGVCPETLWPYRRHDYGALTPERSKAALKYKPSGYQRVPKDTNALRAAVFEHHAVVISIGVHNGWMQAKPTPVIPFRPKDSVEGGHCVAVLGYTQDGFIIQNSWGPNWGRLKIGDRLYPGAALLTYPDFEAHYYDGEGFVATLPEDLVALPLLRRAGYKSDTLEDQDRLDITPDVEAICSVLSARDVKPPLALGLFGNWGTGKSFFMSRMHGEIESLAKLERENPGKTPYYSEIVQIHFNAWHYLDANLWASLVSEIFNRLFDALSDPQETSVQTRRRLIRELGKARGLYRQSRMELEEAKRERDAAADTLNAKTAEVNSSNASLAELADQLVALLQDNPDVKKDVDELAKKLGTPELARSYRELKKQAEEIDSVSGQTEKLLRVVFNPRGRRDRLILLIAILAAPVLVGAFVSYLAQNASGALLQISRYINVVTGLFGSLAVFLAQALKGRSVLTSLQRTVERVESVRQERLNQLLQGERERLKQSDKARLEAQERLEQARQRVQSLEKELETLDPANEIQSFIKDRISSDDYKKQLGLISLIRRDFERLSQLLQTSQALEARWYERLRAAEQAKRKFSQPKRRLLPFQRIVLYIDDLDRCQPARVIEVLEAVHLLLAFPLFVVVVAVDPRWLRQCLQTHYPDLLSMSKPDEDDHEDLRQPSTPQDYLEKIFQIPFYLRPIDDNGYRGLIDGLVGTDISAKSNVTTVVGSTPTGQTLDDSAAKTAASPTGGLGLRHHESENTAETQKRKAPEKLNPEQLKFQEWELNDMKRLSPLFRTPRAVKRFLNTYRLVRVGIPASQLADFEGTESQPGRYRMVQVLLAIVSGYPNVAPRFLQRMRTHSRDANGTTSWELFLHQCIALAPGDNEPPIANVQSKKQREPARKQMRRTTSKQPVAKPSQPNEERDMTYYWQEWVQLCQTLQEVSRDYQLSGNLSDYHDLVPRIARFSFSVSMLPE